MISAPLLLVDASSYFFRAFHALPPLTNSKGQPTGAIYGVVNMIKRLQKDYPDAPLIIIFDTPGKTFRDTLYPAYKATRTAMPDDLKMQFDPLIAVLTAMGFPILMEGGVEADDVIATLARTATASGQSVIISTGDKDLAQLVDAHTTLINTMTNTTLDEQGVYEKFGVKPQQIVDYLSLLGDKVDNIPGVAQCGPKTAVKWLQQYGTLENLIAHSHEITGKIGEHLRAADHLSLSKQLVTLRHDLNLSWSLDNWKAPVENTEALITWVSALEFKSWLKTLLTEQEQQDLHPVKVSTPTRHTLINTQDTFYELLSALGNCTQYSCKLLLTQAPLQSAEIAGIGIAPSPDKSYYIPLIPTSEEKTLESRYVLSALKPLFENPQIRKIGHDLKMDYQALKKAGIAFNGIQADIMLTSYVLNSGTNTHDISTLALKYLGQQITEYNTLVGKGAKQKPIESLPHNTVAQYIGDYLHAINALHEMLSAQISPGLQNVLDTIEVPLLSILAEIEYAGVLIDVDILARQGMTLKKRIEQLESEAYTLAGQAFNLNSPQQLQTILFETLQIPVQSKTPKGQPSTAESVLEALAIDYPLPKIILEYRSLAKLVSTYIDALPRAIQAQTGRVHTTYNQALTATGRLSSSNPNLQNIPIRKEEGRMIRRAFIAPPEYCILAADYSQIELRIMAHLSQDEHLLHAFLHNQDIHLSTASEIFNIPMALVDSEHRRRAKAVNFGLIYGMSAFGLAKQLDISQEEASRYIEAYFTRYPGVLQYMESTRLRAKQQGYVETLFGRRLYVPDINVQNMMRRKAAERMAINAPLQGSAADIIKKAMLAVHHWQMETKPPVRMIMQIHDELVFEVQKDALTACQDTIRTLMEQAVTLDIPLSVSIAAGHNWDEAH